MYNILYMKKKLVPTYNVYYINLINIWLYKVQNIFKC